MNLLFLKSVPGYISIISFADSTTSFVYNYKPANFEEDFTSALTALVTSQDDPQRLKELTEGTKSILNNYMIELTEVLKQVRKFKCLHEINSSLSYSPT